MRSEEEIKRELVRLEAARKQGFKAFNSSQEARNQEAFCSTWISALKWVLNEVRDKK